MDAKVSTKTKTTFQNLNKNCPLDKKGPLNSIQSCGITLWEQFYQNFWTYWYFDQIYSLDVFILIFFVTHHLNLNKFLPPQIPKTLNSYIVQYSRFLLIVQDMDLAPLPCPSTSSLRPCHWLLLLLVQSSKSQNCLDHHQDSNCNKTCISTWWTKLKIIFSSPLLDSMCTYILDHVTLKSWLTWKAFSCSPWQTTTGGAIFFVLIGIGDEKWVWRNFENLV